MKEDKLQKDLEIRVELLTARIEIAAAELAANMPNKLIADYMSRYSTDRRKVDSLNEFLLEAIGKEAQRRLRAMPEEPHEEEDE